MHLPGGPNLVNHHSKSQKHPGGLKNAQARFSQRLCFVLPSVPFPPGSLNSLPWHCKIEATLSASVDFPEVKPWLTWFDQKIDFIEFLGPFGPKNSIFRPAGSSNRSFFSVPGDQAGLDILTMGATCSGGL